MDKNAQVVRQHLGKHFIDLSNLTLAADRVAELHEGCNRLATVERLAHAPLGNAGAADVGRAVGRSNGRIEGETGIVG